MGRAAKNLDGKSRANAARSLFQKSNMLALSLTDPTERGAEADSDAILRLLVGIFYSGVVERQFRRSDGKLCVTIEPFQTMRRKKLLRLQSRISPPLWALNALVSKVEMRLIPLFSARMPCQNASAPLPMQVMGPIPVMTARLRVMPGLH